MACRSRSLTSNICHLSRRFHPCWSLVLHDDCDRNRNASPAPSIPSPPQSPAFSPPTTPAFRSLLRDSVSHGFSLHLALGRSPRFYSSGAEGSNSIDYIRDAAEVLTDKSVEAAACAAAAVPAPVAGEVAAAAADSFLPVAALQHLIDAVHSFSGMNWWAAIALTTLLIRGATLPLLLKQMKATVKLNLMRPELEELKQQMQNRMDPESIQEGQKQMKALFLKHGVTPFTPLKGIFIQGPVFISFFLAISNMVEKVPSFKGGGAFWFTDLTTPDPMYALPVLTALTFWATVELNMQEGMEGNPMANTMKNFSRVLAVLTVPFTGHFPKAIFCYWITSNIFSLGYGFAMKQPSVRKYLNLPDVVRQHSPSPQPSFSFFGGSKSIAPAASPQAPEQSEQAKHEERRVSSSSIISQRIRNLEKAVKGRTKSKKR